jgi:uncharacterized membrane protein
MTVALVALIIVAFWSGPALARPTLPFGVRVPAARVSEPAIARVRRDYTRGVALLGAAGLVGAFVFDRWVLFALIAAYCLLGYHAHRSVAAAKRAGDWYAGVRQAVTTDTSLRTDPVRPQWLLLAPAVLLFAITAAAGVWRYGDLPSSLPTPNGVTVDATHRTTTTVGFAFATVSAQALIIALAAVLAAAIPRARAELDAAQPAGSAARYRTYVTRVLRLLFGSAGCAAASLLVASFQVWEILPATLPVTLVSFAPLATALVAWAVFALRTGEAGHRLPAAPAESTVERGREQRDDDRHWHLAGMVYLNRTDPAILVHRRVGAYWTLNFGNPISWAIVAGIAAVAILAGTGVIDLPVRES